MKQSRQDQRVGYFPTLGSAAIWRNLIGLPLLHVVNNSDNVVNKQRVLMHGHQGWNVRHGLCHIYMIYVYIWVVYSFCLFSCLFIIVKTQFVALYKPKQQICHQHANRDHFGKLVNRWYYNETQSSTWATKIPPEIRVEVNCNYYVHPNLTDI